MLHRQRGILRLLRAAGGEAAAKTVIGRVREAGGRIGGPGAPGYEFVQGRDGPVSFTLLHEAATLIAAGYLREATLTRWALTAAGEKEADRADKPRRGRGNADEAPALFGAGRLAEQGRPAVYTAGYEGLSLERFLGMLLGAGIERLVDVRRNSFSRRFGFHRSTLAHACGEVGIEYVHLPALGIASELREGLEEGGAAARMKLFADYRKRLRSGGAAEVEAACGLVREKPSVLVCLEARPEDCHRSRLAEEIAARTGLPVIHLHAGT